MTTTLLEQLGLTRTPTDPYLVTATITSANTDAAIVTFTYRDEKHEGIIPAGEQIPGKYYKLGNTYPAVLLEEPKPHTKSLLSATHPHLIRQTLAGLVPEIRTGEIRILKIARDPGHRTKIAVAATVEELDPISRIVGRKSNRVRALRDFLGGEQVDIISWHPDPETFIRNALQPATVEDVKFDPKEPYLVTVTAPHHQMAAAVGNRGLNTSLAGRLTKHHITVEAT